MYFFLFKKEPSRGLNSRSQHESLTNNSNIFGGNNNNHSTNRSNRNMQEDINSITGLHHTSQHSFSNISGLALMGKHSSENKHGFHNHHSPETNGMKDLMSPSLSSGRNDGDSIGSAIVKEEPEFYETICHWVGCDRGDLQSQDALVKVRSLDYTS